MTSSLLDCWICQLPDQWQLQLGGLHQFEYLQWYNWEQQQLAQPLVVLSLLQLLPCGWQLLLPALLHLLLLV
jgi:hypothetical protein